MAASNDTVKPWKLTEDETFSTYNDWKTTLMTHLVRNSAYKNFCTNHADSSWLKTSDSTKPNRGFENDDNAFGIARSASDKVSDLTLMLQYIASKVPHYLYDDIVDESTGLESIWKLVRAYYSFIQSEANMLDYFDMRPEPGERPERFYRRLRATINDNKLRKGGILHDGKPLAEDKKLCPTAERLIVGRWLDLLHPNLRGLVKRQFPSELSTKSVKDIQPTIVTNIEHLMAELTVEDSKVNFTSSYDDQVAAVNFVTRGRSRGRFPQNRQRAQNHYRGGYHARQQLPPTPITPLPVCCVCLAEGRSFRHDVMVCQYVRPADRAAIKAMQVEVNDINDLNEQNPEENSAM